MKTAFLLLLLTAPVMRADDFPSWMAGSWSGEVDGVKMEEHWTTADGGLMVSMHRDVMANGKAWFEFARIEKKNGVLTFMAMPGGQSPTPFPLKTIAERRVVFENPEHDYPQRITYWRDGEQLCASVDGIVKSANKIEQWCWSRMK
jgi:hypothetical protein